MKYFKVINKKEEPYPFNKGELEQYENICFKIWGGCPHDVNWAIETPIYKTALIFKNKNDFS